MTFYIFHKLLLLHFFWMFKICIKNLHTLWLCERWKHVNVPFVEGFFVPENYSLFFYPQNTHSFTHRNYQQNNTKKCSTKNKPRTLILISLYLLHQITLFFDSILIGNFMCETLVSSCQMAIV